MDVKIIQIKDVEEKMVQNLVSGEERGSTTYFKEFDNAWTWRPKEVNIWSGYANEGKGTFLRQLMMMKYLAEGKTFAMCLPEDMPAEIFYDDLVHTLSGKSTDKSRYGAITPEEHKLCRDRLNDGFRLIHIKAPNNTIPNVLTEVTKLKDKGIEIFGVMCDPLLKFTRPKEAPERDDLHAAYMMSLTTDWTVETDVSTHFVLHQLTPKKDSNGLYEKPSMYQIKGGGSWSDGVDNVLYVHRPNYAKDKLDPSVNIGSLKIKRQKLVGIPQDVTDIVFDRKSNRFIYTNGKSVFDFDKYKMR